ncbi:conserved hypothetical protein [Thermotomaculum hydrothermale]|uniref:HD domain-containing protein n=1 Tax=Thermotomaculum hydrothermale TaxID=981385 RepID=A0A7R6SYN2_9BACT|nr:HD domain-containing protein [Thermotomaculum hydrothermale]BBB32010.1 conserved hypothetical protein [Thermotomaculum hydrothermale]
MNYEKTLEFVKEKFKDKKDKGGKPYIEHLLTVAEKMESETEKIVALLHDIVEDIEDISFETLKKMGYSEEVISAVEAMTKEKGEEYKDYLKRVKANPIARKVKLADLEHNMDTSRLNKITEKDLKRLEKYKFAKQFLEKE